MKTSIQSDKTARSKQNLAMATSYKWLFLWDYTFYKWDFLVLITDKWP